MDKSTVAAVFWASLLLIFLQTNVIVSPLLYDSLNPTSSDLLPVSINGSSFINITESRETWRVVDPIFSITVSMAFDVVVLGIGLIFVSLFWPSQITEKERKYPKKYFLMVGFFQAFGGVMWQYSTPGTRIATYLQPILSSGSVPIVFTMRLVSLIVITEF